MTKTIYTLGHITELLGASLEVGANVSDGDKASIENIPVTGVAPLARASNNEITFLADAKHQKHFLSTNALAVIVNQVQAGNPLTHCLVHADPYNAYAQLTQLFDDRPRYLEGIHDTASVSSSAVIGAGARIAAGAVIDDNANIGTNAEIGCNVVVGKGVQIGNDVLLSPNVTLCHGVRLGNKVSILPGAVIGSDGFGYAPKLNTEHQLAAWNKIAQLGTVIIGDNVEIGANTTIDRGALDDTIIESNVIIDNQVHIAHNVSIGEGTAIAGCVGIAGSTRIGKRCSFGGGACIAGHITIADDSTVMGMTRVGGSIKKSGTYSSGTGLQEVTQWRKNAIRFSHLDQLNRRVKSLEQALEKLDVLDE